MFPRTSAVFGFFHFIGRFPSNLLQGVVNQIGKDALKVEFLLDSVEQYKKWMKVVGLKSTALKKSYQD